LYFLRILLIFHKENLALSIAQLEKEIKEERNVQLRNIKLEKSGKSLNETSRSRFYEAPDSSDHPRLLETQSQRDVFLLKF